MSPSVAVYGFQDQLESDLQSLLGAPWEVRCQVRPPTPAEFGNVDFTFLNSDLLAGSKEHAGNREFVIRRLLQLAEDEGKIFAVVYTVMPADGIGIALLKKLGFGQPTSDTPDGHGVVVQDFRDYLALYGRDRLSFPVVPQEAQTFTVHALATTASPVQHAAFAIERGQGLVYFLPANKIPGIEGALLSTLIQSVADHASRIRNPSSEAITRDFRFSQEDELQTKLSAEVEEVQRLRTALVEIDRKKDLLYLRSHPLAERLPQWFAEYLGIQGRRIEEYVEDFWLVTSDDKDAVICEAKGLNKNVTRQDISQLVLHREERDLPDEFPSLLVVNTFALAATVKEKANQRIGSRECRKAVRDHVLVTRTIDLLCLLDLLERGEVASSEIWTLFTTETGWLRADSRGLKVVKE